MTPTDNSTEKRNEFVTNELKRLNQMRKDGLISNKEYQDQKQRLHSYE